MSLGAAGYGNPAKTTPNQTHTNNHPPHPPQPQPPQPPPTKGKSHARHPRQGTPKLCASLWASGSGGASQSWFVHGYAKHGLEFDRILAWEYEQHTEIEIRRSLPAALRNAITSLTCYMYEAAVGDWGWGWGCVGRCGDSGVTPASGGERRRIGLRGVRVGAPWVFNT